MPRTFRDPSRSARYVEDNKPVGQFSDVVTTATNPQAKIKDEG